MIKNIWLKLKRVSNINSGTAKNKIFAILIASIFFWIDVLFKYIISADQSGKSYPIISHYFAIKYTENYGSSFSLFSDMPWLVALLNVIALIVPLVGFIFSTRFAIKIGFAFILLGAIDNFADRVILGYVIDYISVELGSYTIVLNVADLMITYGVIHVLVVYVFTSNAKDVAMNKEEVKATLEITDNNE
ncbi:MAG: signal peptidase II [Mycoplasma sp.]